MCAGEKKWAPRMRSDADTLAPTCAHERACAHIRDAHAVWEGAYACVCVCVRVQMGCAQKP